MNYYKGLLILGISVLSFSLLPSCSSKSSADYIFYGNVITLKDNEDNDSIHAIAVKDNKIIGLGNDDDINSKYKANNTKCIDYGDQFIYPGFVDAHTHPVGMSAILCGGLRINNTLVKKEDVLNQLKQYIKEHPGQHYYKCFGSFVMNKISVEQDPSMADYYYNHQLIDEYLNPVLKEQGNEDAVVMIIDEGGHSGCLNTNGIKWLESHNYGLEQVKKEALFNVINVVKDEDGNEELDGNIAESPFYMLNFAIPLNKDELKEKILIMQDNMFLPFGYTTLGDCLIKATDDCPMAEAIGELAQENKLKMKIRGYMYIQETDNRSVAEQIARVKYINDTYSNDYFRIIGIKLIIDGILEKQTCLTKKPYNKNPFESQDVYKDGYYGINRWSSVWRPIQEHAPGMKELIMGANKEDLSVSIHTMGDGAIDEALKAFEAAKNDGVSYDRNCIAHCCYIDPSDFARLNNCKVNPVVQPLWNCVTDSSLVHEKNFLGEDLTNDRNWTQVYKVKEYIDKCPNCTVSFHTDGMCHGGLPQMLFSTHSGVEIDNYKIGSVDCKKPRDQGHQLIKDPLLAMKCSTINPAYLLHSENELGSIEVGKAADFSIYNVDFRNVDNYQIENIDNISTLLPSALVVNGKQVYTNS